MPLTILQYITPSRLAGAEYFFLRVVEHLARKGHRVIVVTKRDTPLRGELEKLLPLGIELHAWHTHGKLDPKTLARLCRLIETEGVQLINTHLTTASWQGALAGKWTHTPTVAVVHATDRKTWFQHADHLIAVSRGVKTSLTQQGIDERKIEVLYHGIDLDKYVAPLDADQAKIRLGLATTDRTVGVAASLISRKGHRFLLQALHNLQGELGPIHAIFAGEGELEAELRAQANSLGLGETTHFLGFRRDVSEIVCAFDAFILPSLKEGLSIAVMEAMALEKPVICSNIAGLPEVVRDGETGILVEPGDIEALENAVRSIFQDPETARQLGRNARRFLEANFEQNACLDAMEEYFCRIARSTEKPRISMPVKAFERFESLEGKHSTAAGASLSNLPPAPRRRPLTILQYITPSRIGGAERYFLRLVAHLARAGHRVIVVTKRDTPLRCELEKLVESGVRNLSVQGWLTHGKVDPQTLARLVSLARSERVDLINTHLTTASWLGSLAGRMAGVPVVARVPATERPRFYSFADHLIAVSHGVRDHLVREGVAPEKIAVFYNGIDLQPRDLPPSHIAKHALGLPEDSRVVGVAASLIFRKGHRFLLEAIAQAESQTGPLHLLLAGEGDQELALREQAQILGLTDRVHFLGFQAQILPVLAAMDVFVLPSLKEGLSNAVMEAMALGKPVVATNIAGMPEIVHDGKTGLLVEPGDIFGLAGALRTLFLDPHYAAQLGRAGREFLELHLDQNRCLDEVEDYLGRIVAWNEAGRPMGDQTLD